MITEPDLNGPLDPWNGQVDVLQYPFLEISERSKGGAYADDR